MNAHDPAQVARGHVGSRVRLVTCEAEGEADLYGLLIQVDAEGVLLEVNPTTLRFLDWAVIRDVLRDGPGVEPPSLPVPSNVAPPPRPEAGNVAFWYPKSNFRAAPNKPRAGRSESYRRAKEAQHYAKDPVQYEHWLRATIEEDRPDLPSAAKDLAWLLSSRGDYDEALALLKQHEASLASPDPSSVENLTIAILLKAQRLAEAARLCEQFARGASPDRVMTLERQKALFLRTIGGAREAPPRALDIDPDDLTRSGAAPPRISPRDISISDLSGMAQFLMRRTTTTRRGLLTESVERGIYAASDIRRVERQLQDRANDRPRDRGELLLTLAWLCFEAPNESAHLNPLHFLRQAFLWLGRAALEDRLLDSARALGSEALLLYASEGSSNAIDPPLELIAATYLSSVEPECVPRAGEALKTIIGQLLAAGTAGPQFVDDLAFYCASSQDVLQAVLSRGRHVPELAQLVPAEAEVRSAWHRERSRLLQQTETLDAIREDALSIQKFATVAAKLRSLGSTTRFGTDRIYLTELAGLFEVAAIDESNQDHPATLIEAHERVSQHLPVMHDRIVYQPTSLSVSQLLGLVERIGDTLKDCRSDLVARARPVLRLRNLLADNDYYIQQPDGTILLTLGLASDEGGTAVTDLRVVVQNTPRTRPPQPLVVSVALSGGESTILRIPLDLTEMVTTPEVVSLPIRVRYLIPLTQTTTDDKFSIAVRIRPASTFKRIDNPYSQYASSGRAVAAPEMFFGRNEILDDIIQRVATGPGRCVVLYGEARCGKSSVMHQLERRLAGQCLVVRTTFESLATTKFFVRSLVAECLRVLRSQLQDSTFPSNAWPSRRQIDEDPLGAFTGTLRGLQTGAAEMGRGHVVLLLDEFGLLYHRIGSGDVPPAFMEQWRGLLESDLFSAVVAGRDMMFDFRRDFWPAFARADMCQLGYLTSLEVQELAERPVTALHERFRGKSLQQIYDLTAGQPFYAQVLCDSLVKTLNLERSHFVTEAHVDRAVARLVSGPSRIPEVKFGPLLTAASANGMKECPPLLAQIAMRTLTREEDVAEEQAPLLKGLIEKEVVTRGPSGELCIRVRLMEAWLRELDNERI